MSDGYRNGAFALGVVTGGGIVLNLFFWSAYRANKARDAVPQGQENPQSHPWVGFWDWLIATFVNPYDTIAQWGMALLSLAAVYLLWETLKASRKTLNTTREMALGTARIGEAQVRAYLTVDRTKVSNTEPGQYPTVRGVLKNSGQTPGQIVKTGFVFSLSTDNPHTRPVKFVLGSEASADTIGADAEKWLDISLPNPLSEDAAAAIKAGKLRFLFAGAVCYRDVFGNKHGLTFRAGSPEAGLLPEGALQPSRRNNYSN